jgi:hypothetical protein
VVVLAVVVGIVAFLLGVLVGVALVLYKAAGG